MDMQHSDFLNSGIAHNYPQDHVYTLDGTCLSQQPVPQNGDNIIYNPSCMGMSTDTCVGDGSVQDLYQHQFQDTPNFGMSQCVEHANNMENTNMVGNPVFVNSVPNSIMTAHNSLEQSLPTHMDENSMHKDSNPQQSQGLRAYEKSSSCLPLTSPNEIQSLKFTSDDSVSFYQNRQASTQLDTRANGKTYTSYRKDGKVHYDHQLKVAPGNLSNRFFQQPLSRNWAEAVSMVPSTSSIFHGSLNRTNTSYYNNEQHCIAARENFRYVPWQEQNVNMSDRQLHWDPNHQQVAEVSHQQFAMPSLNQQQGEFMERNPTQNAKKRCDPQEHTIQSQEAVGTRCYTNDDALIQPTDQTHIKTHDNVDIFQAAKQRMGKIISNGKHDITTSNVNTSHGSSVATTNANVFRLRSVVLKRRQQHYPPPGAYKCKWKDEVMCGLEFHNFDQYLLHVKKAHLKLKRKKRDVSSTQNNDRRFQCLWNGCEKTFKAHYKMCSHIRVHTGEKPFACEYCSLHMRRPESIKIHMRTHTGEKPFKCHSCSKTFGNSSDRKKHSEIHKGKRWPCNAEGCTKHYSSGYTLKKHMKDKHSSTKE